MTKTTSVFWSSRIRPSTRPPLSSSNVSAQRKPGQSCSGREQDDAESSSRQRSGHGRRMVSRDEITRRRKAKTTLRFDALRLAPWREIFPCWWQGGVHILLYRLNRKRMGAFSGPQRLAPAPCLPLPASHEPIHRRTPPPVAAERPLRGGHRERYPQARDGHRRRPDRCDCSGEAGHEVASRHIVPDEPAAIRELLELLTGEGDVEAVLDHGRHRHRPARSDRRRRCGPSDQDVARLRRAAADAQLRPDRPGRDAQPCGGRRRRRRGGAHDARLAGGCGTGHDQAHRARAGPSGVRGAEVRAAHTSLRADVASIASGVSVHGMADLSLGPVFRFG